MLSGVDTGLYPAIRTKSTTIAVPMADIAKIRYILLTFVPHSKSHKSYITVNIKVINLSNAGGPNYLLTVFARLGDAKAALSCDSHNKEGSAYNIILASADKTIKLGMMLMVSGGALSVGLFTIPP